MALLELLVSLLEFVSLFFEAALPGDSERKPIRGYRDSEKAVGSSLKAGLLKKGSL